MRLLKVCVGMCVVLVAYLFKSLLWDTHYFTDFSHAYTSKLSNCVDRRDLGVIEQLAILPHTHTHTHPHPHTLLLLPSSDLWHFLEKREIRYNPKVYVVDLDEGVEDVKEVEVVGIDVAKVTTFHGVDVYVDNDGRVYFFAVTHTQHYDETTHGEHVYIFEWKEGKLFFQESITFYHWTSLNDIAAVGPRSFYVTIDHLFPRYKRGMQTVEELLMFKTGQVDFFDGTTNSTKIVADGFPYANGVKASRDRTKVYVASSTSPYIHVYSRNLTTSDLKETTLITLNGPADNIYVDDEDQLWIASIPQVIRFALAGLNLDVSPPQVIRVKLTNVGVVQEMETVHFTNGSDISCMTTAVRYKNRIVISGIHHPLVKFCDLEV